MIPLGSVASRVTLLCNENGRLVSNTLSDSRGFNNPNKGTVGGRHVDVESPADELTEGERAPRRQEFRRSSPGKSRDATVEPRYTGRRPAGDSRAR